MTRQPKYSRSPSPSAVGMPVLGRRSVLRGMLAAGAVTALPSLTACGGGSGGGDTTTLSFGSNETGSVFAEQRQAMADAFTEASGTDVALNAVDHNTFQENISTYLQGNADDVFTWFAGYRMRFFAEQGLIGDVSDVWPLEGVPDSFKQASTGNDGKQYFVPQQYYPWAVFYRKSVFEENGYTVPTTLDQLVDLCEGMRDDGLVPFAFGDKDGWPAMGTFDMINMRVNGFDFHIRLMSGEEAWNGPEVKAVFETWRDLMPFHQTDSLGRTWQEAAQTLQRRESGLYVLGTFLNEQFPDDEDDLDLFTFPEIDPAIGATAIDAPIDGFCMSADPDNPEAAREFLAFLASAEAAAAAETTGLPFISASDTADTSGYSALQKKSAELVGQAEHIAQFLDRDTRPDFASTVIIPSLQAFISDPDDIDDLVESIESQKQSIFVD
ncbi:ABC transporter substrate-binding protein [Actinorugispora endophytica]|uniref:Carbohydrate ABC transporter substrate-binding protein (CUT1 family) n=1 Tax=Actinorugispora endophytica TaxID=1605990 RepID=A0A4V3D925_9ACTN|nr:ABC transporter substrate-binding protein [Actinorugispora endophytica]TDQ54189.1 carbohydrate ABC transporter substrate-binding protein (CUT1 family) [Actinorugispora endophytica]